MWRKRKASSVSSHNTDDSRRKRWKSHFVVSSSEDEDDDQDQDQDQESENEEGEWDIKCILEESEDQYLIDWEGAYSPTWEPKDNANDVAIKVWEDKKKQKATLAVSQSTVTPTPISIPSTPEASSQSPGLENSDPVICETEQDNHIQRRQRSPSPLFVPLDTASSDEEDIPLVRPPRTPGRGLLSQHDGSGAALSPTQESHAVPVFEHVRKDSIPPEFLLPGESVDVPQIISKAADTSRSIPSASEINQRPRHVSPCIPETDKQPQRTKEIEVRENRNTQRLFFPEKTAIQPNKEVEIAETPPGLLAVPGSQTLHHRPQEKDTGSQFSSQSINIQSDYSRLVSQISSSSGTTSSESHTFYTSFTTNRYTGTIPESTAPSQSQNPPSTPSQIVSNQSSLIRDAHPGLTETTKTMENQNQDTETRPVGGVMDKYSHIEGSTPREKMRNAYAQLRAKSSSAFSQNIEPSATPSSAGDIEPSAPLSIPETAPLSVRSNTPPQARAPAPRRKLSERDMEITDKISADIDNKEKSDVEAPGEKEHVTHPTQPITAEPFVRPAQVEHPQQPAVQTIQPSALTFSHVQETLPASVHLGQSEFAIPLPMDSRVKDDYERVLANGAQITREFIQISDPSSNGAESEREHLALKTRGILEQLSNVATHPDLNIAEHINDSGSDLEKEAAWAEYSSAKFLFLGYLVQLASDRDLHLVIMVQGGKTYRILERYLLGKGLAFTRPRQEMGAGTNLEVSMVKGSLSFGIQSTQSDGVVETYKRPSAMIALDRSFNAKSPSVQHMRTIYARDGSLLPVIRLLISNSSEHVERCFRDLPVLQHLRLVMQYTTRLRDMVGDLQDDALGVHEDAEEVLSCLQSDNFHANWPLPVIEPLQIFSPDELDSAMSQSESDSDGNADSARTPSTQKRQYVEDSETASKRQRVDPSQDATQLTESSKFPSQTLGNDLQALEANLMQMKTAQTAELDKLRKALVETQSRLVEREKGMEKLQHRYEFRTKELHQVRQERDRLTQSKTSSEQRIERQKEELAKVKDERTELRHELEKARESLKTGGGSMAELENAREEIRRLTKEQAGLERKSDYEKNQAEYTREQYQNASKAAAQSGNESRQLKEENEELKRKVAGDAARLREINVKNDESRHLSRVEELEGALASREDMLHRKEEELREFRKNRPSTRATSTQPRSPKWAATSRPGSPGINNNNNNNNSNGLSYAGRGSALRFSSEMSLP